MGRVSLDGNRAYCPLNILDTSWEHCHRMAISRLETVWPTCALYASRACPRSWETGLPCREILDRGCFPKLPLHSKSAKREGAPKGKHQPQQCSFRPRPQGSKAWCKPRSLTLAAHRPLKILKCRRPGYGPKAAVKPGDSPPVPPIRELVEPVPAQKLAPIHARLWGTRRFHERPGERRVGSRDGHLKGMSSGHVTCASPRKR